MADPCFWHSALLYLYRPNLINKRLIGAKIIKTWHCSQQNLDLILSILIGSTIAQLKHSNSLIEFNSLKPENLLDQLLNQLSDSSIIVVRKLFRKQSLKSLAECSEKKIQYDCWILLPSLNTFAELPLDLDNDSVVVDDDGWQEWLGSVHLKLRSDDIAFTLKFDGTSSNAPKVTVGYLFESTGEKSSNDNRWLESVFKPKFEKWLLKGHLSEYSNQTPSTSFEGSIRMVSVERYCQNLFDLKQKYVHTLMDIWCEVEKTDPIKFIYEDIAIAAYLITLWQEEMEKFSFTQRQTFGDIGCGNGLLVYILTNEGYNGYGVDVRRRNIWSFYGNNINLIEMRIDLFSADSIDGDFDLPKCDWLIGNHSDELTPWIVYMAASASPFTRAFILPCCCYDFDGFKFQRNVVPSNNKSQYQCYIDFIQQLCTKFGFECFRDKLRIPSTKRICLVCYGRTYHHDHHPGDLEKTVQQLVGIETDWKLKRKQIVQKSLSNTGRLGQMAKVRLRNKEETVRNCSRIEQKIKEQIISRLAAALLQKESTSTKTDNGDNCLSFQEAIHLLDDDDLRKHLKNQCGGLQTFIRNHKHIFTIVAGGGICFQSVDYFLERQQRLNKQRSEHEHEHGTTKTKECWFHTNHPRGCPLSWLVTNGDDCCPYKHL